MSDKIRVKLVGSPISTNRRVRELKRSAAVEGMVKRLKHLVIELKD